MKFFAKATLVALLVTGVTNAQEEDVQVIEIQQSVQTDDSAQQEGDVVGMQVIASDEFGGAPAVFMTRNGESSSFSMPSVSTGFSFGNGSVDSFSLLNNPSVQKDLELVGDQMDKIREVQRDFGKQISEQVRNLTQNGFKIDDTSSLRDAIKRLKEKQKEAVQDILLDHQRDRLKQVALQMNMKRSGAENALANDEVAEELGLTETQIENLKSKAKELKKKMEEQIKKIREDARKELLQELSSDQRSKLEKMTGDKFKSDSNDWKSNFRPFNRKPNPKD